MSDQKITTNNNPKETRRIFPSIKMVTGNRKILFLSVGILVLLVVICSIILSDISYKNGVHAISTKADQAFNQGQYDTAITTYKNGLEKYKNDNDLLTGIIKTYATKGNQLGQEKQSLVEVKPYIAEATVTGSSDPATLEAIGYAYETAGQYQTAQTYYQKALTLAPNTASTLFHLGHVLEFLGNQTEAYSDYKKAYSLDKNQPQIVMAMGNILLAQGKQQDAFDMFKQAAAIPGISATDKSAALTAASIVRGTQNRYQYISEAVALSTEAVAADPNFSPALAAQGYNLYLTEPTTADGFAYTEKAIIANPRIAKNYYMLGLFYRAAKDYPDALHYLQEAVAHVDQDNTILSTQEKNQVKGQYLYDLAETYSVSNTSGDTLSLLQQSLQLNLSLKSTLQKDVITFGYFKELETNHAFLALVK